MSLQPPLALPPVLQTNNELEAQRVATEFAFRKRLREMEKVYSELRWQEKNVSLLCLVPGARTSCRGMRAHRKPWAGAPRWVQRVKTSHPVPADLGRDRRAAGGHPAPGGGSAQKVTEPEAMPYPTGVQNLPAQCGALPGPGAQAPQWDTGSLPRLPQDSPPQLMFLVEQGCWWRATPKLKESTLTWASQPTPPSLGTVRPHG